MGDIKLLPGVLSFLESVKHCCIILMHYYLVSSIYACGFPLLIDESEGII